MLLFGLIGYPLGHSFSAAYFNEKFKREGIDAEYRNFPIESVDQFEELVRSHPNLKGINVTIPYKQSVIPYLDGLSQTARAVQAVNTICFCLKTGRLGLLGHNTDVNGFERSLKENLGEMSGKAMVLGTGGASKAVLHVLEEMGIPATSVSRTAGDEKITYSDLDRSVIEAHSLIINTTPLGMHPDTESLPDIPYEGIGEAHLLFDLVYNPEKTRFLEKGEAHGAKIVNGKDMLIYQAEAAWEIWKKSLEVKRDH